MIRRLLLIIPASLVVLALCVWYWLLHTESGLHWIWARAQLATDSALQAQQVQGDLGSGVTIRQFEFATDSTTLIVKELRLVADLDLLPLQVQISEVFFDGTNVQISKSKEASNGNERRRVIERLALPLPLVMNDVNANDIHISGLIPNNDIAISQLALAGTWHEEIVIDYVLIDAQGGSAEVAASLGLVRPFLTTIHGDVTGTSALTGLAEPADFQLQADGNLDELEIDVTSSPIEMSVRGTVSGLLDSFSWDLQAQLAETRIDFGENDTEVRITNGLAASSGNLGEYLLSIAAALDTPDSPPIQFSTTGKGTTSSFDFSELDLRSADITVSGNGRIAWGNNWSIESRLNVADTPVQVDANVDWGASTVDGAVRWQDAKWPLIGDSPTISSKSGDFLIDGTIDDWRISGDLEVGTATMPLGRLRVDGGGDKQHVEAAIIDSEVLGGSISGQAAFHWRDPQRWSAELDLSGIELNTIADDWPDDVTGRVDAEGHISPFRLSSFKASALRVLHGDTRIDLDGDLFALSALTFDVVLDDTSQYLAEASGDFTATGKVTLHPQQPSLHLNARSSAFGFRGLPASAVKVVVNGDSEAQNLRLDASSGSTDIHLFIAGQVDDLKHPSSWTGELRELGIAIADEAFAELTESTAISLSKNAVTIRNSCIAASTGMRLCAQADWSDDSYLTMAADLHDVPVELVNNFISTGLQFDQLMSGDFEWSQSEEAGTTGKAKISTSAGTITSEDYPDAEIVTEPGLLSFDTANGQLLSGNAELSMPGIGHVAAQFSIPDIANGANSDINGLFDIDLSDMAVLATLSPLIDEATGEFRADLALSGTLSEPQLDGDMAVIDGSLAVVPLGLRIDDINLTSLLHEGGQVELSGNFLAGEGRGEIVTRADYSTSGETGFELELLGTNMTLIDTPNVTTRADLDVRIGYDFKNLILDGDVLISHARVNPTNFTVASESESDDVVIVAGELPDDSQRRPREQSTWITGSVGIELGDDVLIDIGPATAKLIGKTVFSWDENLIPIADGRYDLTGNIQVFGQVLEITEGGLRFPQIPANDPFVRIRAEREIYGNVQVKTAGVLVDGTLRQFSIEPYTRPLTTEERALTLLVTGSDFDFEQGLGAIDFGTYIAPRVFVSYGVGLFETENVVRVRYDLKRGFGVTATSGEKETGIDLSYRIER